MVFGNSSSSTKIGDKKFLLESFEMNLNNNTPKDTMASTSKKGNSIEYAMDNAAFQAVRNHISSLDVDEEDEDTGRVNTDLIFLKSIMESPIMTHLVKVQDKLEDKVQKLVPVGKESYSELASDICQRYDRSYRRDAKELSSILRNKNFKALLEAHDTIVREYYGEKPQKESEPEAEQHISPWEEINILKTTTNPKSLNPTAPKTNTSVSFSELSTKPKDSSASTTSMAADDSNAVYAEPIRVVGLRKSGGQPLGVTVEEDGKNLVVARVLSGGMIDRLKLLKVGDVILEVNSVPVSTPQQLVAEVAKSRDYIQLKVGSPIEDKSPTAASQVGTSTSSALKSTAIVTRGTGSKVEGHKILCFMRTLFTYDPSIDTLIPCKEIGLGFSSGEILQIMDQSDPNWWQAKKVGESVVGLIPSRELEERRAAFVRPEADFVHSIGICGTRVSRKKKRIPYTAKKNSEYDKAELSLYEEVTRMPPFRRKTLILVGATGVGRRTLKTRLLNSDPHKFGTIIPITSRPPLEGVEQQNNTYIFISREEFEEGIRNNLYLEFGEREGHYYGTSYESVRDVIRTGRMCIIDCNPTILKILHSSPEFMPYVVFLAAPGADRVEQEDEFARKHGYSSRNLAFDRMSSIRYSSRRARTLESIASLYEEDSRYTVEESQKLQRMYSPYFDLVLVNEDFDSTFRRVSQALDALSMDHQWVPVTWVY